MNLQGKIEYIKNAVTAIKNAIVNKGVTPAGDLSTYANAISDIETKNNTSLTVNPSTSSQIIRVPAEYTGYDVVTVNPVTASIDSNITSANIVAGKSILGVNGSAVELNGETRIITSNGTYTPSSGKNGMTSVIVDVQTSNQIFQKIDVYTTNIVAAFDSLGNTINVDNFVASCLLMFEKQSNLTNKFISGCIYIDGDAGQSYLIPAFSVITGESSSRRIISAYISPSNLYGSNYNCLITSINELGAVFIDDLFLNLSVTV